jgi:hypothetical protein
MTERKKSPPRGGLSVARRCRGSQYFASTGPPKCQLMPARAITPSIRTNFSELQAELAADGQDRLVFFRILF